MSPTQENKTQPTAVPIADYLSTLSPTRREEAETLIALMQGISGQSPVLWGPSIVGFGTRYYRYETGREGDMPQLAFSPRKAAITIYLMEGFHNYADQLSRLGKHKTGVGCLYINKLSDVELSVLKEMLEAAWQRQASPQARASSVEDYLAQVPAAARPQFDRLRAAVRGLTPNAQELLSYGILGYKTDNKRAKVFISGFKDHVAIYPIPADPTLKDALKPYVHGKGSIWFSLSDPLPLDLIERIVKALL
ncbi:MAG TPA: DUF1801 domain-containing protein [Anaerolineaceae bacterium]|nr:DUF1801 domain-containing protein [Anaerolineaceae bacterium]